MASYIFIETRPPFSSSDRSFVVDTAIGLRQSGHEVTVFFAQNGVLALRKTATSCSVELLVRAGARVLADDLSLCERGVLSDELSEGVRPVDIGTFTDLLVEADTKAIWH